MQRVLIVSGGWSGHKPEEFSLLFEELYKSLGIEVVHRDELAAFDDLAYLKSFDILMPNWTMGALSDEQEKNLCEAVKSGVSFAGVHGGAGDAFRSKLTYQWMVGGQFVGHPYVGEYEVRITQKDHPVCKSLKEKFLVNTEQYYLLCDASIQTLAETTYIYEDQEITMPVVWVKKWGQGKVFYSALGHDPKEYESFPEMRQLLENGIKYLLD